MLSPIPKLDCSLQLLALFYLAENKGSDLIYVLSKATALIPRHEMVVLIQCLCCGSIFFLVQKYFEPVQIF